MTDYRDPVIQDEINKNGWAIWPPVRYSYNTVNNDIPEAAPSKPFWLYTEEQRCQRYPQGVNDPNCIVGNFNWLGTDDQARDVFARALYGFRISVLFGLILTFFSAVIGVTAGPCRAISAAGSISSSSASSKSGLRSPCFICC